MFCTFSTTFKTILADHIKTNHKKKQEFKCPDCTFTTSWQSGIKKHQESAHGKPGSSKNKRKAKKSVGAANKRARVKNDEEIIIISEDEEEIILCE